MHLLGAAVSVPYPSWLNTGDNTWQIVAATFVGLMSLPGLAVLYASIVQKKWAVNVLAMMFAGFSLVLIAWVLWSYKMGFGATSIGGGVHNGVQTQLTGVGWVKHFFENFVGKPGGITDSVGEQGQAVSAANTAIPFHFPTTTLAYFQFVFAAITPLLFLGSVLGRIKFSAWCLLVPLWSTFVYGVDAFLLWGGGYFAQEGSLDFSGGFVIHMSAGVSGFVAAWVLGPRLLRDRQHAIPNNLVMAAVGAGILWLGWNGFNGGDPYYAGTDAAAAVVNTNVATAVGVMVWIAMDAWFSKAKKPTFLGGRERHDLRPGGDHALRRLGQRPGRHLRRGDVLRHRVDRLELPVQGAALLEGRRRPRGHLHPRHRRLLRRHAARHLRRPEHARVRLWPPERRRAGGRTPRPRPTSRPTAHCAPFSVNGLMYTGSAHQLWEQFRAALFVIFWSALVTFILMKLIGLVLRGARYSDEILEIGDLAIHDEEAFPDETFAERVRRQCLRDGRRL